MDELASLLGGGGLSPSSSTSQSTPFYNESGIYFSSPDSGNLDAGAVSSDASTPNSRQQNGGIAPVAASAVPAASTSLLSGSTGTVVILGGIALLVLGTVFFLFKK